jgi:voltage-gated sodium channel
MMAGSDLVVASQSPKFNVPSDSEDAGIAALTVKDQMLLHDHVTVIRGLVASSMDTVSSLITQRIAVILKDSSQGSQAEIYELRKEVSRLREKLQHEKTVHTPLVSPHVIRTGGTGDIADMPHLLRQTQTPSGEDPTVTKLKNRVHALEKMLDVKEGSREGGHSGGIPWQSSSVPSKPRPPKMPQSQGANDSGAPGPPTMMMVSDANSECESDGQSEDWEGPLALKEIDAPVEKRCSVDRVDFAQAAALDSMDLKNQTRNKNAPGMKRRQSVAGNLMGRGMTALGVKGMKHSPQEKSAQPEAIFADASAMKEKIRAAVSKKEYNVKDFYWQTGCSQKIARSSIFENITLSVIACNALWIAVDTDNNKEELLLNADLQFIIAENLFCAYFLFELVVRFCSFECKSNCLGDPWFCFDSMLVLMMVLETWVINAVILISSGGGGNSAGLGQASILKLVRLVRLTRMARMARLLRAIPELIILIKGIFVASRSVTFTLVLLVLIMYLFAIIFRQLAEGEVAERYFPTVPGAMASLLLEGVIPDMAMIIRDCSDSEMGGGPVLATIILLFVLLASLTVMNMLIGVLCEVVGVVSSVEKEQLTVSYVKNKLLTMYEEEDGIDIDGNSLISKEEFQQLLMRRDAAKTIQEIGVDVVGLVDFSDYIFKDGVELSFADLMELVLQFRGSNQATVKDIVDLRRLVLGQIMEMEERLCVTVRKVSQQVGRHQKRMLTRLGPMMGDGGADGGHASSRRQGSKEPTSPISPAVGAPRAHTAPAKRAAPGSRPVSGRPRIAGNNNTMPVAWPTMPPALPPWSNNLWDEDDSSQIVTEAYHRVSDTVMHGTQLVDFSSKERVRAVLLEEVDAD